MAQSLSTIDNLLKTQYLPAIVDTFQEEKGVLGEIMKRKEKAKGGNTDVLVRVGRNSGIGFRSDGDTLPAAGNSTWLKHTVDPKLMYGRIQVSGPAMARTEGGSAKSFLKSFVDETKHTIAFMKKQANVALWGAEDGYLAEVESVTADTLVLKGVGGAAAPASANDNAGSRHFAWAGEQLVSIIDASTGLYHQVGMQIDSVDHSTDTLDFTTFNAANSADFTVAAGGTPAIVVAGDKVILYDGEATGATFATAGNKAFEGIQAAIDDGSIRDTYHGISRSSYPQLKSVVLANGGSKRGVSEALLEDLFKSIYLNSGKNPSDGNHELRTSLGIHSTFMATQIQYKRFQNLNFKAGHDQITFNGVPFKADVDAPFEAVYCIDWSKFKWLEVDPLGWLDTDGRVLLRTLNTDAYEARLRLYGELVMVDAHCQGVLRDITDSAYVLRS